LSNTFGRANGYEKAQTHIDLSAMFIAIKRLCSVDAAKSNYWKDVRLIHDATQKLTSYLNVVIKFPLTEAPDSYDDYARKFFDKFIEYAEQAWSEKVK
jgi:hypothetical protein